MRTKWICTRCRTITLFAKDIPEEDFKCSHCSHRHFLPVRQKSATKQKLYRLCWKHKDFKTASKGPILRHYNTKKFFNEKEANARCEKRNLAVKNNLVRHWIEEVERK